jgi:hypothetical protein
MSNMRNKLRIAKSDTLLAELDSSVGIRLVPATVLPMENYSEERLKEFKKEDALPPSEQRRLRKTLYG